MQKRRSAVAEHAWKEHHPILWQETGDRVYNAKAEECTTSCIYVVKLAGEGCLEVTAVAMACCVPAGS